MLALEPPFSSPLLWLLLLLVMPYTLFSIIFIRLYFSGSSRFSPFQFSLYIVSTIKKTGNVINKLIQATPRNVLAVIISKPLELKIFEKEINQVLLGQKMI